MPLRHIFYRPRPFLRARGAWGRRAENCPQPPRAAGGRTARHRGPAPPSPGPPAPLAHVRLPAGSRPRPPRDGRPVARASSPVGSFFIKCRLRSLWNDRAPVGAADEPVPRPLSFEGGSVRARGASRRCSRPVRLTQFAMCRAGPR